MTTIADLQKRLERVEARNQRVSADKAWETSVARRVCIAGLTYIVVSLYLLAIHKSEPFINALVPVMGYLLSTLVLAQVKAGWIQRVMRRK